MSPSLTVSHLVRQDPERETHTKLNSVHSTEERNGEMLVQEKRNPGDLCVPLTKETGQEGNSRHANAQSGFTAAPPTSREEGLARQVQTLTADR